MRLQSSAAWPRNSQTERMPPNTAYAGFIRLASGSRLRARVAAARLVSQQSMANPAEIAQEDPNTRCHKTWISGKISGISFPLLMRKNGAEDPIPGPSVIFMVGTGLLLHLLTL